MGVVVTAVDVGAGGHLRRPVPRPEVVALGIDLIWFGVVTTIAIEIGLLTPPFGLSVYVIKAAIDDPNMSLGAIFAGAAPFVLITFAVTLLLVFFQAT